MALRQLPEPAPVASFLRQQDILPVEKLREAKVTLIGAGAVGSFTALTLAKMGIGHLEVYDGDSVESHNLPNQWYRLSDLGSYKVDALKAILETFSDTEVVCHSGNFSAQPVEGIVVSAVDSMDARMSLWRHIRKSRRVSLYLDTRMGAEVGKIFAIRPGDPEEVRIYEQDLYPSSEALQVPCTARATVYCASGLAAFTASTIGQYLADRRYRRQTVIDFRQGILI